MATIQANIKYATNLAELQRNLELGRDAIETTAAAADQLASRLGGDKLIRGAHTLVAAIDQLGGVTKLTRAEQDRALATLDKTIEKMQLMGKTVPSDMQRTADSLRKVTTETEKSSGAFSKLSTFAISVGTAIGTFLGNLAYDAVRKLGGALVDIAQRGLTMAPTVSSFESLTRAIGESGDEMVRVTRTATKGLILDLDIMAAANKAMLLGLPVTSASMATMAETAVVLGKAMNLGPTKALDDLTTALGRSSPMILDNLGLSVKVGEANDKYAASIGKVSSQLTDGEKKLAFYNAAMDAAKAKVEELGGVKLTLADQVLRLKNLFVNFTDQLGVAIATSPVLTELLGTLADTIDEAFGQNQVNNVRGMVEWVNALGRMSVEVTQVLVDGIRGIHSLYSVVKAGIAAISASIGVTLAAVFSAVTGVLSAASMLPGVGGQFEGAAESMGRFTDKTWDSVKGLSAMTEEAAAAVVGYGPVQEALGRTSGRLNEMRERLRQAGEQAVDTGEIARRILGPDGEVPTALSEGAEKIIKAWSGVDAQKKVNDIAQAFWALNGQLNTAQIQKLAQDLLALEAAGARIPPSLRGIADAYRTIGEVQSVSAEGIKKLIAASGSARLTLNEMEHQGFQTARQAHEIAVRYREVAATLSKPVRAKIELPSPKEMGFLSLRDELEKTMQSLAPVSAAFQQLAQIAGDAMHGIVRAIGTAISSVGLMGESMIQIAKGGFANFVSGAAGMVASIWSIVDGMMSVFESMQRASIEAERAARRFERLRDLQRDLADVGVTPGARPGQAQQLASLSDDLIQRLLDLEVQLSNRGRLARELAARGAEAMLLGDIIDELGGLTSENLDAFEAMARPLIELVARDVPGAAAALEDAITRFAEASERAGGLWSDTLKELMAAGHELDSVVALIAAQRDTLASSMGVVAAATAKTQEEFDRLSRIGLAAFNTLVNAGLSSVQAIRALGPSIDSLIGQMEEMGFQGNEAFNQLLRLSSLVEANAAVLDQLDGLNQLLIATANLGGLTAESFADIEAQGLAAFQSLLDAGFTQQEALAQIAPLLATINRLHQDGTIAISEETQALIDQAREQGLIAEDAISTNDILMTGLQGLADLFGRIFGVEVPRLFGGMVDDAERARDGINDAFEGIEFPDLEGPSLGRPGGPGGGEPAPAGFAVGTPALDFLSFGSRGTRATLHNDEAVIPRGGGHQLAAEIAAAMAPLVSSGGGPRGDVVLNINGREFARAVIGDINTVYEQNDGGGDPVGPATRIRKVVGVN